MTDPMAMIELSRCHLLPPRDEPRDAYEIGFAGAEQRQLVNDDDIGWHHQVGSAFGSGVGLERGACGALLLGDKHQPFTSARIGFRDNGRLDVRPLPSAMNIVHTRICSRIMNVVQRNFLNVVQNNEDTWFEETSMRRCERG